MPPPSPALTLHLPAAPRSADTPASFPDPVPWVPPADWSALHQARLYAEVAENRAPLDHLAARDLPTVHEQEWWIALVPGSSEALGHHRAWFAHPLSEVSEAHPDRETLVEPEFRARLEHGYRLLCAGLVRYLLISGGSIDAAAPDYNEARFGREQLLREHRADWTRVPAAHGDPLQERLFIDPWAIHSVSNCRNHDRLSALLRLDRNLVVTTTGTFSQGWWFVADLGGFGLACRSQLGYPLGPYQEMPERAPWTGELRWRGPLWEEYSTDAGDHQRDYHVQTRALAHRVVRPERLLADSRWE